MVMLMSHTDNGIVCDDHRSATSRIGARLGFAAIPGARLNAVRVVVAVVAELHHWHTPGRCREYWP